MTFEEELMRVLPLDIPQRDRLVEKSARHLELVAAANEYMNLTRIASPRDAAIKHVLDSVLPWPFFRESHTVLDAGTGAGFPGIPLAILLPEVRFVLAESVGKKARFLEGAVETLDLPNVRVVADRAESVAQGYRPAVITARAMAPLDKLVRLFKASLANGSELLAYKGRDVDAELSVLDGSRFEARIVSRRELPEQLGVRTLVSVQLASPRKQARANRQ